MRRRPAVTSCTPRFLSASQGTILTLRYNRHHLLTTAEVCDDDDAHAVPNLIYDNCAFGVCNFSVEPRLTRLRIESTPSRRPTRSAAENTAHTHVQIQERGDPELDNPQTMGDATFTPGETWRENAQDNNPNFYLCSKVSSSCWLEKNCAKLQRFEIRCKRWRSRRQNML